MISVARKAGRIRFAVRVVARSSGTAVAGERDGALLVRVTAPPADGRANDAVLRALARALDIAPSEVRIEAGAAARSKVVSAPEAALERLRLLCN